ncbi:hypothetical protein GOP47_0029770 [Adiantum capillus-veneris]|nr:hypothetical protein GOP47_0029770 [Adiantum capillus-veneris]
MRTIACEAKTRLKTRQGGGSRRQIEPEDPGFAPGFCLEPHALKMPVCEVSRPCQCLRILLLRLSWYSGPFVDFANRSTILGWWRKCFWLSIVQALLLAFGMEFCSESLRWLFKLAGINAVFYFSSTVFRNAGIASDLVASASVGIVNLFASCVAACLMDRQGRRKLLIWSFTGMVSLHLSVSLTSLTPTQRITGHRLLSHSTPKTSSPQ